MNSQAYNYSYGISFWIFIHEHPPNHGPYYNKYVSLFNYGDKPNILYNMKEKNVKNTSKKQ